MISFKAAGPIENAVTGSRGSRIWVAWCLMCTMQPGGSFAAAPVNRAAESRLPRGDGLAAGFGGDVKIASHADVIFADNFEERPLGGGWDEVRNRQSEVLQLIEPGPRASAWSGRRALQVTATLGTNTGGGLTKWFESSERIFIRFYTKFARDCDYVHHFCTLRANRGLSGKDRWSGFGGAGKRPAGDERFSTALEAWGNWRKWPPPGRWNFYSYWHQMQASRDGNFWGNAFRPDEQPDIRRGEWICCEFMLRHNRPGEPDGEQAYWIDGELRGHWQGINWRTSPSLWANSFTLETYVTDRWTKNPVNIVWFDNVVIARNYIGPAANATE